MPQFSYSAVRMADGSRSEGTVEAKDKQDAHRRLSAKGLQPIRIALGENGAAAPSKEEAKPVKGEKAKGGRKGSSQKVRLTTNQVILFTQELSDLLGAGIQLEQALKFMEGRGELSAIHETATRVRESVRDGMSFSRALAHASPSFGELYCNLMAAGEVSGALAPILKRQVRYLTTMRELRGKVLTAMIYPAFLVVSGLGVMMIFITFLVPKLTGMIESTGGPMPMGAQMIIGASNFLQSFWWAVLLGIAGVVLGFQAWVKLPANRPWWDRVRLRLPLFGPLQRSRFQVQFLETMANLLGNGMTLLNALKLSVGSTTNVFLQARLKKVVDEVSDGAHLHRAMERSAIFPSSLVDLVRVGEQTGRMGDALANAGERFDRELTKRIEQIGAFVQPVIILAMALMVGTMAYLMITVIYDTISILRQR